MLKLVNDFNITFSSKCDSINKEYEGAFKFNYSDDINLPLDVKVVDNLIAIKSDPIVNKYLGVEYNDLEQFNVPQIDIEEFENGVKIEDVQKVYEDFKTAITTSVTKSNFSKTEDNGYELILTDDDIDNMISKMSDCIKTYEFIPAESRKEIADGLLEYSKKTKMSDIHIIVYKDGKIVIRVDDTESSIQITESSIIFSLEEGNNSAIIRYSKNAMQNQVHNKLNYEVKAEGNNINLSFETNISNIDSQNTNEKYVLSVDASIQNEQKIKYEYTVDIARDFSQDVKIDSIKDNCIIINKLDSNTQNTLSEALVYKYMEVNQQIMQQLGTEIDPMLFVTPYGYIMTMISGTIEYGMEQFDNSEL